MSLPTRDEFKTQIEAVFDTIDKDKNGYLSSDESWAYHQECAKLHGGEANEEAFK